MKTILILAVVIAFSSCNGVKEKPEKLEILNDSCFVEDSCIKDSTDTIKLDTNACKH